jgi:hypothetical protein
MLVAARAQLVDALNLYELTLVVTELDLTYKVISS